MKALFGTLFVIGFLSFVAVSIVSIYLWYDFKSECGDYLKLAGDAPTVEKASEFLNNAVGYIEHEGITSGNSAFIFHTPANDVGVWYGQLKGAQETVDRIVKNGGTQLEKDNVLMKIREVVLDQGESGVHVTKPVRITWYPNQWLMCIWWIVTFLWLSIFGVCLLAVIDN